MTASVAAAGGSLVRRVATCSLTVTSRGWDLAERQAAEIDAHWQRRVAGNPAFFNGTIHLLHDMTIEGGRFDGRLMPVEFKSFLYWKDHGYPDSSVRDIFGSALIRSAEGRLLLGRQSAGNLNAGLAYLPGGFIDPRDVAADRSVDIRASVAREIREEIGLQPEDVERLPGFILTFSPAILSIGVEFRSRLSAAELLAKIETHIQAEARSELAGVHWVSSRRDIEAIAMPPFAGILLKSILPET